ncbi:hypothetical protein [Nonomuraea dietziae]|uniref:hypothetical protein n=1 Tax=Nonomuraea dietziae TaxID=65515 RepID=UPI0031E42F76
MRARLVAATACTCVDDHRTRRQRMRPTRGWLVSSRNSDYGRGDEDVGRLRWREPPAILGTGVSPERIATEVSRDGGRPSLRAVC